MLFLFILLILNRDSFIWTHHVVFVNPWLSCFMKLFLFSSYLGFGDSVLLIDFLCLQVHTWGRAGEPWLSWYYRPDYLSFPSSCFNSLPTQKRQNCGEIHWCANALLVNPQWKRDFIGDLFSMALALYIYLFLFLPLYILINPCLLLEVINPEWFDCSALFLQASSQLGKNQNCRFCFWWVSVE